VTAGAAGTLPPLANTVGSTGGSSTHLMLANEIVAHAHPCPNIGESFITNTGVAGSAGFAAGSTTFAAEIATGNNAVAQVAFTIVQPTAIVNKLIRFE
jgi:hypothetical protein